MKKTILFLSGTFFLAMGLMSIQNNSNNDYESNEDKEYCMWIRQDGKNWYECSPKAFSPSNAVDLVKKKYPKANVTRSSDGNCKCN